MMKPGRIYFYTATILKWNPILFNADLKQIILDSLKYLVNKNALKVYGYVIMPNHIHLIIMPLINSKIKNVQLSFMRFTAQKIKFYLQDNSPSKLDKFLVKKKDRTFQIWKRKPLFTEIYSRKVLEQKLDYIHNNPLQGKWRLANSPLDYQWSSMIFYETYPDLKSFLTHYIEDV